MSTRRRRHWFMPVASIVVALILTIVPLPESVAPFRPDWAAVVLLYWSLIDPRHYGLLAAFGVGLIVDSLVGTLLGQHSLALLLIVYLSQRFHDQIRTFPASQIALTVFLLLGLYEFILMWIDGMAGHESPLIWRWGPVVSGGALWLLILSGVERSREEAAARM